MMMMKKKKKKNCKTLDEVMLNRMESKLLNLEELFYLYSLLIKKDELIDPMKLGVAIDKQVR